MQLMKFLAISATNSGGNLSHTKQLWYGTKGLYSYVYGTRKDKLSSSTWTPF